jgi:hypothetical protein
MLRRQVFLTAISATFQCLASLRPTRTALGISLEPTATIAPVTHSVTVRDVDGRGGQSAVNDSGRVGGRPDSELGRDLNHDCTSCIEGLGL